MAIKHRGNTYLAKEIMKYDYPKLWYRAIEVTEKLVEVQNKLAKKLPGRKENLPKSYDELTKLQAQRNLSNFICLRLLYEFAGELWKSIDNQCRDLTNKHNENDIDGKIDSESALHHMLDAISIFPFDEIAKDKVAGIIRFNENYLQKCFRQWVGNTHFESWRCDVMGGIREHGMQCDWLWRDAVDYRIPDRSNICELLPDKEINKNS